MNFKQKCVNKSVSKWQSIWTTTCNKQNVGYLSRSLHRQHIGHIQQPVCRSSHPAVQRACVQNRLLSVSWLQNHWHRDSQRTRWHQVDPDAVQGHDQNLQRSDQHTLSDKHLCTEVFSNCMWSLHITEKKRIAVKPAKMDEAGPDQLGSKRFCHQNAIFH